MFDEPLKIFRGDPDQAADLIGFEKPGMDDVVSRGPGDLEDPHNILNFQVFFHLLPPLQYHYISIDTIKYNSCQDIY